MNQALLSHQPQDFFLKL